MVTSMFPLWVEILALIGISLSLISSSLVLFSLFKIQYQDFSTHIRKYSTLIDISSSLTTGVGCFYYNSFEICILTVVFLFAFIIHALWAFYMSFSMYQIICQQKEKSKENIKYALALCLLLGSLISSLIFIAMDPITCVRTQSKFKLYLTISLYSLPQFIILLSMIYFYAKIKIVLTEEINKCDAVSKKKRDYFFRIIGYPIIFFLASSSTIFSICTIKFPKIASFTYVRILIFTYYPLLNSIFYGMTQSSKRMLRYAFGKNQTFLNEEELLHELREANYIFPRFYLDLIDQPEEPIFK